MRVLWFANTACSATQKLGLPAYSGGWLSSLELELNKQANIELGICFYSNRAIAPFDYNGTHFYPVCKQGKTSKLSRWFTKMLGNVLQGDMQELELLKQVVDKFQPDIIHVHGTEENFGLLCRSTKIPLVISLQGVLTAYAHYYFKGIPLEVCKAHEGLLNRLSFDTYEVKYKNFLKKAERERTMLKDVNYVFGRTAWDKAQASLLAPQANYMVSEEVLRAAFYDKDHKRTTFQNPLQIITTAGDTLYKGFETIVNSAALLVEKSIKFEWKVIGLSQNSETVKLVTKWKKNNNLPIVFCGPKDDEEIASMMQTADIYVQCSHIENSPNSLCEAMLMGMPVIASAVGGTASLLEHGKEGVLYDSGDTNALTETIVYLQNNFELAQGLGHAARERALKRHNKSDIVTNLISSYEAIIAKR